MRPLLGAWPETRACALTGNRTCDRLIRRPVLNPLSHPSQGRYWNIFNGCLLFILLCICAFIYQSLYYRILELSLFDRLRWDEHVQESLYF